MYLYGLLFILLLILGLEKLIRYRKTKKDKTFNERIKKRYSKD